MKRYLSIYKKLFLLNLTQFITYRANFVNSLVTDIVWGFFTIISMVFITSRVSNIGGWSRGELLLLSSSFNILLGTYFLFFSKNFWKFSETIHLGKLDTILLKPLDSQFFLSSQYSNITKLVRVIISIFLNIYLLHFLHINPSITNILGFIVLIFLGLTVLYSLSYISATFLLWNSTLSNLMGLTWDLMASSRYPKEIFVELNNYVFLFILPITLVVSTPTKVLIHKAVGGDILLLTFFALFLFLVSRIFWQFALRFYTSANI